MNNFPILVNVVAVADPQRDVLQPGNFDKTWREVWHRLPAPWVPMLTSMLSRLAAIRPKTLTRRDYSHVSVSRTCDEILDFILVRVVPQGRGPRPRFSLYLSAQLMFGTLVVYQKQHEHLLNDAYTCLQRLRAMTATFHDIDMEPIRGDYVTIADPMDLDFLNPWFGIWGAMDLDVSQPALEMWRLEEITTSSSPSGLERSFLTSGGSETPRQHLMEALGSPHTVSSLDQIRLKEQEVPPLPMPEEVDIPMLNGQDLEQMLDLPLAEEQAPMAEALSELQEAMPQISTSDSAAGIRTPGGREAMLAPTEQTPGQRGSPPAEPPLVRPPRRLPLPEVTPGEQAPEALLPPHRPRGSLQLNLAPLEPREGRPARRRRGRRLIIDNTIQMRKKQLRQNMVTHRDTTEPFELPFVRRNETVDYFNMPASRELRMNPRFLALWRRNAVTRTQDDHEFDLDNLWTVPDLSRSAAPARRGLWADREAGEERDIQPLEPSLPVLQPPEPAVQDFELAMQPQDLEMMGAQQESMVEPHSIEAVRGAEGSTSMERSHTISMERSHGVSMERDSDLSRSRESAAERSHLSLPGLADRSGSSTRSPGAAAPPFLRPSPGPGGSRVPSSSDRSGGASDSLISLGMLDVLVEEPEVPFPRVASPRVIPTLTLVRTVEELTVHTPWTTFRRLCPLTTPRPQAAHTFMLLLESVAVGELEVRQKHAYGEIYVRTRQDEG